MKKLLLRGLLCLALTMVFLPAFSATKNPVPKLVPIQQKTEGFAISLPADWTVQQNLDMQGYQVPLVAVRPAAKGDVFRENIVVVAEKLPYAMNPVQYLEASLKGLSGTLKGFKAFNNGPLRSNRVPATYLIYTHKANLDLKVIIFFIPKGEKGYTVSCSATPASFARYLDLFMAIGQSFTP
jgi:hypothetical protein